ncbi:MAG TPA: VOC family protein [Pyrinomonadaceae bacterium]|nr:VOC family protein [Pyrinomonadaceae bacterium]
MGNPVMHWQILTSQPDTLEKFYSQLFGWKISSDNSLGYKTVDTQSEAGIGGGIWPIAPNEGQSMVQLFVRVDNVANSLKTAESLGAKVVIPLQKLPDGDEMAVLTDPDGIPFALFKGLQSMPL